MKTPTEFYIDPESKNEKHLIKAGEKARFDLALRLNHGLITREEYEKQVALTYIPGKSAREMTAPEAKAALAKIVAEQAKESRDKKNAADMAALEAKHSTKAGNPKP